MLPMRSLETPNRDTPLTEVKVLPLILRSDGNLISITQLIAKGTGVLNSILNSLSSWISFVLTVCRFPPVIVAGVSTQS
jgi:hypothetical protein